MTSFLVCTIVLLALTLSSLGSGVTPSAAGNGPSGAASLGMSEASGRCSKAAANAVVKRLGLGDPSVAEPVFRVLCGSFTGPGSQTMVASISGPENVGMLHWAVFRWTGGAWQFLIKRRQAAVLTAVGSDIRETVSVFRAGDPRCCPSGGTKARIWHWSGSGLVAGAWKQVTKGAAEASASTTSGYFKTPSGNIVCFYAASKDADPSLVVCGIKSGLRPAPPRRPCEEGGYAGDRVVLRATGRAHAPTCAGDPGPFVGLVVGARVLGYGKTWSGGGLRCTSAVKGLTCRNKSGHGFFLSRERWRAF